MKLPSCVALIAGACIGSAVFSISGLTIHLAGPAAVLSWIIAAVIALMYGLVVSRLALMYPQSGGIFVFPRMSIGGRKGRALGFLSGWGYIVSNIIAIAFSAIYMGLYLHMGFPAVGEGVWTALCALALSVALILSGGRLSQSVQNLLVVVLVAMILLYCGISFFGGRFDTSAFSHFFSGGKGGAASFLRVVPMAIVAYNGCVAIAFMASEVLKPERNIRLSLIIGLSIVALLYSALVASVVGTLPSGLLDTGAEMRYAPLMASLSGWDECPAFLPKLISICVAVALFTTMTALLRVNARAIQALSYDGLLPSVLGKQDSRGVAWGAAALMTAVVAFLCFHPQWTYGMINMGSLLNVIAMVITCVSLLKAGGRGRFLAAVLLVLLPLCYVPEIIQGSAQLWIFTALVYLAGTAVGLLCSRRSHARITGTVVHGKGHGRKHGMPTANIEPLKGENLPECGVWKTSAWIDGRKFRSLTNVGLRPSDDDSSRMTVETLILGFRGELYGRMITVEFEQYLRKTMKFADLDELKIQIDKDIEAAYGKRED